MADLSRAGERGQVILIAAVALAVTFVTLALVVNSAIFTENLASRGETSGGDTALVERYTAERRAGDVVAAANRNNFSSDTTLEDAVEAGITNSSTQTEKHTVLSGALSNTSNPRDYEFGSRVVMNGSVAFQSADGDEDWRVVNETDSTRAFSITIDKSNLGTDSLVLGDRFRVRLNDTGASNEQWLVTIWREGLTAPASNQIHVKTQTPSGTKECVVTVPDEEFEISLTEGTVDSRSCEALEYDHETSTDFRFAAGIDTPYNISFRHGDEIAGNYSFVTERGETFVESNGNLDASPTTGSPYVTEAVYEVDVTYMYVNSNVNYTTTVRVARGEADG